MDANPSLQPTQLKIGQQLTVPIVSQHNDLAFPAQHMEYWYPQTYTSPSNATLSIAIYGWGTQRTIEWAQNKDVQGHLIGDKYIAFGGAGQDGKFSEEVLGGICTAVRQGLLNDYDGIAFDIETIAPNLEGHFADCFQELQNLGFKVLVTVNHATRRSSDDHDQLVRSFFPIKT